MEINWEGMSSFGEIFGIEWLVITLLVMVILGISYMFTNQMKAQAESMKTLSNSVDYLSTKIESQLDIKQSLVFFNSVMSIDVLMKLRYLGEILRVNSIKDRQDQLQINIAREFKMITNEQCSKLSDISSVCGDMGKIFQDRMKWDNMFNNLCAIFFGDFPEQQKMKDIRLLLESIQDDVSEFIQDET